MPKLTLIIGANGAGKTTWRDANEHRLQTPFYNADSIAMSLGDANDQALQIQARDAVDQMIADRFAVGDSFGFESTYSGRSRPTIVRQAHGLGYKIEVMFLGTEKPEINLDRVQRRFEAGGHDIPPDEIIRRWTAARDNLIKTWDILDVVEIIDTSRNLHQLLAVKVRGKLQLRVPEKDLPDWFLPIMRHAEKLSSSRHSRRTR